MNSTGIRFYRALALFLFSRIAFSATSEAVSLHVAEMTPERYEPVLERQPFGPPPPSAAETEAGQNQGAAETTEAAAVTPEGLDKVEGQSFEDFTCEAVHFSEQTVTLRRSGISAELPLWINPATTNCADVLSYGQPAGKLGVLPQTAAVDEEELARRKEAEAAREELKERRRKAYEEMQERRRRHAEEMSSLSPDELEKRLHDINTDLIISGNGPPLPIDLNDEDRDKLHDAGFDVGRRPGRGGRRGPRSQGRSGESGQSAPASGADASSEGAK